MTASQLHMVLGWSLMLVGGISGAVIGLRFHESEWAGGYASFRRRLLRLGHIACFGLGFVNLGYALTVRSLGLQSISLWPSRLFIVGAVSMPLVCYLSAFRKPLRYLFPIPVVSLLVGAVIFVFGDLGL